MREVIERQLGSPVATLAAVGGGSISSAYWCRLENGRQVFVKAAPEGAPEGMFAQEVASLRCMAQTETVRVPEVLAAGGEWLILEWLEPATESRGAWRTLSTQLARMHRVRSEAYGWDADNFIGPLHQPNAPLGDWPRFWRERRLLPQLQSAESHLDQRMMRDFSALLDSLDDRLGVAAEDGPSLLHGDLWSGNVQFADTGAVLFDPSCYYGHREVDLAMAALFGGFSEEFRTAYEAEWPLLAGAAERRAIYQLYYLLVHVNLFGGQYVEQTRRTLRSVL